MQTKLETVGTAINRIQIDRNWSTNYVHQLPKLFGLYLGDVDSVKLCSSTGSFSFDRPPHNMNKLADGFALMVRVPATNSNAEYDYTLVRLCLTIQGTSNGVQTLNRMRLLGGNKSAHECTDGVCAFLFQYLTDLVDKQITCDMRFVNTIKELPQ